MTQRAALLSVSDRTGLEDLCRALVAQNYVLLATSGTAKFLTEKGIKSLAIEEYTGQKEILDGRVKTLHPKIHAGLLARRDKAEHMAQLESEGIMPIDVAVVNLYPFIENLGSANSQDPNKMIELIDIGGPTMIRASAKNFKGVLPLIDPTDYPEIISLLGSGPIEAGKNLDLRRRLSVKVFTRIAHYNLEIARYFSNAEFDDLGNAKSGISALGLEPVSGMVIEKESDLRYGENPQQKAAFYRVRGAKAKTWEKLGGKELSYNNLLDFDAALKLTASLDRSVPGAVIIKHLNPCGVSQAGSLLEALKNAKRGDPRSHFGGVLGFNQTVSADVASDIRGDFAEIVLAPAYEPDALEILRGNKNLRIIQCSLVHSHEQEVRVIDGGVLVQTLDQGVSSVAEAEVVSKRTPTAAELKDLQFAWSICAHVKSNAIAIAKERTILATGAGQMSRIDSVELALSKAKLHEHNLNGAVAASDAFFPFPDSVETLASSGITAIISPRGAKRDQESIDVANKLGISLLFAGDRHFRH